jgi:ABC-2 type transport system ATP-binding protein
LQVRRGECYGVLGPNGAGKTTTIEILEGLLTATSGTARVLGLEWGKDDRKIRQKIGVSLQETELSDKLTVRETLSLFRSFYPSGISVDEAIARVSLEEKRDTWIKKLSGGQKQRLAVATALVGDPQVVFLDEPTTGLDPVSRRQLWEIIQSLVSAGRTVLLTTHYMDEAERLCDRVAIFDAGKVIAEGTPIELIRSMGAEHRIEISWEGDWPNQATDVIQQLAGVESQTQEDHGLSIFVDQPHRVLPGLVAALADCGVALTHLATRHATLEDLFVRLTGKHLMEQNDSAGSSVKK